MSKREPKELKELYETCFQESWFGEEDLTCALLFMGKFVGDDVQRLRPNDRFLIELRYIGVTEVGGPLEEMMWEIVEEYRLTECHLDFIDKNLFTVNDFVELYTFLRGQLPGKVDLASFPALNS